MRNRIITVVVFFLSIVQLCALDASISFARFYPSTGAYVEVYLSIIGGTLTVNEQDGASGVEVLITFTQDGEIKTFNKYNLVSPSSEKVGAIDLLDLQRFGLENGIYDLEVQVTDLNNGSNRIVHKDTVHINMSNTLAMSDIRLLSKVANTETEDNLTLNGLRMETLTFNYAHASLDQISVYLELYRTNQILTEDFFIQYQILNAENGIANEEQVVLEGFKRQSPSEVNPLLLRLDLSTIKSGNYVLNVQCRNKQKELLIKKEVPIIRSNPSADLVMSTEESTDDFINSFVMLLEESKLDYYLRSMAPLLSVDQTPTLRELVKSDQVRAKRYFLYNYWKTNYQDAAEIAFKKYTEVADVVDQTYNSGFGYGFETDRGYIFLKYGLPDDRVTVEEEPSAPPYEMWLYDKIDATNQRRVKFVFYNPSLVPNDYILLHSTCRGERNNPAWEVDLYRDALSEQNNITIDSQNAADNLNRNARRFFDDL